MAALVVEGGRPLAGVVTVEGNKNAALPILAACLLTREPCVLENVPRIRDVAAMCQLLEGLGARVEGVGTSTLRVQLPRDPRAPIPTPARGRAHPRLGAAASAPLLARGGRAGLGEPGGDFPGRRSVTTHRRALAALGACPRPPRRSRSWPRREGLKGASFYLDEASVTATETALLAAVTASGATEIRNAACEPHVGDLVRFLRRMGAADRRRGHETLRVTGVGRSAAAAPHRRRLRRGGELGGRGRGDGRRDRGAGARALDMEPIVAVLCASACGARSRTAAARASRRALEGAGRVTTGVWPASRATWSAW